MNIFIEVSKENQFSNNGVRKRDEELDTHSRFRGNSKPPSPRFSHAVSFPSFLLFHPYPRSSPSFQFVFVNFIDTRPRNSNFVPLPCRRRRHRRHPRPLVVVAGFEPSRLVISIPLHGSPVTILEISPEFLETRALRSNVLTLPRARDTQSRSLATRPPLHPLSLTREFHPICIRLRDALGLIHPRVPPRGGLPPVTNSPTFLTLYCRDRWARFREVSSRGDTLPTYDISSTDNLSDNRQKIGKRYNVGYLVSQ